MSTRYEFYGDAANLSDIEKQKLSELYVKILGAFRKIAVHKNDDPHFEIKKEVLEEELIELIKNNPNILFTIQHNFPENGMFGTESMKTLYSEFLDYGFTKMAAFCLTNPKFRNTMVPSFGNKQYPITSIVFFGGKDRSEILHKFLEIDSNLYTQVDESGQNLGMYCAGPNCQDLEDIVLKFLDHDKAAIAQDKEGMTIGMHCATWSIKSGVIKASRHPQAKELCDKHGKNIFDYAEERKIKIPDLTEEEIKETYKQNLKKSLK